MENLENEIWKDIIGYEGLYQVSDKGRIKILEKTINSGRNKKAQRIQPEKIKKLRINKSNGYLITSLHLIEKYKPKTFYIHRIVAETFIPNFDNKKYVNHIDHDKLNNCVKNLEWVTNMENTSHAKKKLKRLSKYNGVSFKNDNKKNPWYSYIKINKKIIHLGCFNTEQEAYEARKKFEQDNGISNKYI